MEPITIALTTVGWLISVLINKGFTALLEEWAERVNLGKEYATLKNELINIKATLTSGCRLRTTNNDLLTMLKNLQQLAYEADDLLDELDYYRIQDAIESHGGGNSSSSQITGPMDSSISSSGFKLASRRIFSIFSQGCCSSARDVGVVEQIRSSIPNRITMSSRMNELVKKVKENNDKVRQAVELEAIVINTENHENQPTGTVPHIATPSIIREVFGRDREQISLNEMIVGEEAASKTLTVIAIVGQGGVGKTTLANAVYHDIRRLRRSDHFDLKMWVTVSDNFNVQRIIHDILLKSASDTDYRSITEGKLHANLERNIKAKRFLLVLDNLWEDQDTDSWDSLLAPLKNNSKMGNVVLVTTRKPGIINLDSTINVFGLGGFEEEPYWSLFKTFIFGDPMYEEHRILQSIARKIAEKLKGNPLAAKTMGALLRKKLDERRWRGILEREDWKRDDKYSIMPALRISYENLLPPVQCCFAYCALFPKDYKFKQELLVNLWAAQSLLINGNGKRLEEVGEEYFDSLVDSGFFEKIEEEYKEPVYIIHDLLHDLAQNVCSEECLSVRAGENILAIPQTVRHLSIISMPIIWGIYGASAIESSGRELKEVENKLAAEKLSTIMHIGPDKVKGTINSKTLESFQNKFKDAHGLRVLRLSEIPNVQALLSSLHSFTHLRYLQLAYEYSCNTLPTVICRLYHLQVLDVTNWENLTEIPNNFSNLINLRHFIVNQGKRKLHSLIANVRKLANIQELHEFKVRNETEFSIEQLRELNELGKQLCIYNLENLKSIEQAKGACLIKKPYLNGLHLSWDKNYPYDVEHNADAEVLEGLQPHPNLKKLEIMRYGGATSPTWLKLHSLTSLEEAHLKACVAWETLPPLGQLPYLKKLHLSSLSAVKEIGTDLYGSGGHVPFQHLAEFEIRDLPKLVKWVSDDRCQKLPALSTLIIDNCPELDLSLPCSVSPDDFSELFPNLTYLRISGCAKVVWLSPLPSNDGVTVIFDNVGSFEKLNLLASELLISKPCDPNVWDGVCFCNSRTRTITSVDIRSNMYPIPWDNLLKFSSLRELKIKDSVSLFPLQHDNLYNQISPPLKDLKLLHLSQCGITGKHLTWMLHHMPMLSHMELNNCHEIKSIEAAAFKKSSCFRIWQSAVIKLDKDEALLQIPAFSVSLLELCVYNCSDLAFASNRGLSGLVSLRKLTLTRCSRLLSSLVFEQPISKIHLLPPGLQELWLEYPPEKTSLLLKGLSSLTRLTIKYATELNSLDFTSCVALENLELYRCGMLDSLYGLKSLACMKHLVVNHCPAGLADAWISASEIGFSMALRSIFFNTFTILAVPICRQLTSLQTLFIQDENAINITEEQEQALVLLTSLKEITFFYCTNLQVLPGKFHLIHSLKKLEVHGCRKIQSIPEDGFPMWLDIRVVKCCPEVDKLFHKYKESLEHQRQR